MEETLQKLHNWEIITLYTLTFADGLVCQRAVSTSRRFLLFCLFDCIDLRPVPLSVYAILLYRVSHITLFACVVSDKGSRSK